MPHTWLSMLGKARSYGLTQATLGRAECARVDLILFKYVCVCVGCQSVYVLCVYLRYEWACLVLLCVRVY